MRKRIGFLGAALLVAVLALSLGGCSWLAELFGGALYSVNGKVVNARDAAGVADVEVTLTSIGAAAEKAKSYKPKTGSDGKFVVTDVVPGKYSMTGSKAGFFIAPQIVDVSGWALELPIVQAFSLVAADEYGLSFILAWNPNPAQDLDLHLSYPIGTPSTTFTSSSTPYSDDLSGSRSRMYHAVRTSPGPVMAPAPNATSKAIYMDRDDLTGAGPETMNLVYLPWTTTAAGSATPADTATGLGVFSGGTITSTTAFSYYGAAELYVNAYSTANLAGSGTRVYCIQTNAGGASASLLGVYTVPNFTTIKSASILRVLMFTAGTTEYFMIVPDIKVIPEGPNSGSTFKSVDGIIGVRGKQVD